MPLTTLQKMTTACAGRPPLAVEWVTTGEALAALEAEWRALARRCPASTVFQSWEWTAAWWRAFGDGRELRVGVARSGDRAVGIAPLTLRPLGSARLLEFLGAGRTDYLAFLTDAE